MLQKITVIGQRRYPAEACGVLLPTPYAGSQVIELPNRSLQGHDEYIIWSSDLRLAITDWAKKVDHNQRDAVAVWHTHPSGNVGPSRMDMRKRIEGACYLVVALTENGAVPTWF